MRNKYEIIGDTVLINIRCKGKEYITEISLEDFDKVDGFTREGIWSGHQQTRDIYVRTWKAGKEYSLHRLILDFPDDMMVDHINHDTLDNKRNNLRIVTNMQNQHNRKGAPSNSKSGVRGVTWSSKKNKWKANAMYNRKLYYFGYHDNMIDAIYAVVAGRNQIYGYPYERKQIKTGSI